MFSEWNSVICRGLTVLERVILLNRFHSFITNQLERFIIGSKSFLYSMDGMSLPLQTLLSPVW